MSISGLADPGIFPGDGLMSLAMGIIRIVAYGALGAVLVGFVTTCCCCFFEGLKGRGCDDRSVFWKLMH